MSWIRDMLLHNSYASVGRDRSTRPPPHHLGGGELSAEGQRHFRGVEPGRPQSPLTDNSLIIC